MLQEAPTACCASALNILVWSRALTAWYTQRQEWAQLVHTVMLQDWSWADPALDYIDLYYQALKP